MRIRGFKHKHKETLYKDDGRNKETTETSRDRSIQGYTEYKIDENSITATAVWPQEKKLGLKLQGPKNGLNFGLENPSMGIPNLEDARNETKAYQKVLD